ncbi:glycosyltransferase [Gracilibacillus caseinilyticus]|uniref:Glycosyltransferase n=1 Tax=Gracilibacillus caseinilyticus TaxID=2932256 RepID=A0ABY4EWH1_9BACI|nr:glycosyltransferase [Gracilibacillus caseinilyticus]UOQ48615.1 glycosyltransferase [Gracilibacillus caseinilyticus]
MNPKVTIVMPFYNCSYVDQAIESALAQTYDNVEIIVVDDGSTSYTEKIKPYMNQLTYIRKENGGTATALNRGIQEATGDYLVWLSSDDVFYPEKVAKQMTFTQDNKALISFTNFDIIDNENNVTMKWGGYRLKDDAEFYKRFLLTNIVNGCTVMIKKDLFDQFGLFKPEYRYTQDYEMWYRLIVKGYKFHYLDEVLTNFRRHEESGTNKHLPELYKEMHKIEQIYRPQLLKLFNIK